MKHITHGTRQKALHVSCFALHARRGQIIIEAIVAISILVTGFLGMLGLLSRSLFLNRAASDDYTASYLAAEGIEIIKNMVDTNVLRRISNPLYSWNTGLDAGCYEADYSSIALVPLCPGRRLVFDPSTMFYGYSGTMPTNFVRTITLSSIPDGLRVNSRVRWTTGGLSKTINLEDIFYDWRP